MRRTFSWLPWVLLILVIAGFFAWQQYQKPKAPVASDGIKMPAEKVEPLINTTRTGGVVSYSAAVKVAAPAVVNIFTTQKVKQLDHPLLNDPAFREFFGNQIPDQFSQNKNENSLGSGVIVALLLGESISAGQWLTYLPIWLAVLVLMFEGFKHLVRHRRSV